ncbi:nitric oxide synthase oxygenase [Sporosarcina sp. E16_8]|uniref:nitric oxide synthase oxygenase n=1 Tax=Sporosarcina sp. E16_8 TaxID=2789295 RepID=UPI002107C3A7|nr:nitric oxide synthase oxygenase [Sporosarcina sp. E16_8]MBO0587426.1 nitric oxide synthase oxygenase [Sporosarcina sp. E16_8]
MSNQTETDKLLLEAEQFIHRCYAELGMSTEQRMNRIEEIRIAVNETGTYSHTSLELEHGARMAWRNNNRCIGRLFWDRLHVFDQRAIVTAGDVCDALLNHIKYATNDGKIRSSITIFPPRQGGIDPIRVWNHQLIRYAGYEEAEQIIGDSTSVEFTSMCVKLGWIGERTPYDVLPLVIQLEGESPRILEIPKELVKEVTITHPQQEGFNELDVKWYAVPIISDMRLEIGGINYPMAPFNGWYMGTEIGARNLADEDRYNLLPKVAEVMGLDTKSNRSLWKDKALVELNIAVLNSYQNAGVTLVDHHTAAKQFKSFEKNECAVGRGITGNWTWLIPPLSPATTHVFHKPYSNDVVKPNYFHQKNPGES